MKRRVISLWLPRLPTDRLRRQTPDGGGKTSGAPLITVAETGGRFLVASVTRAAEIAGLTPGMTLADARAVCPTVDAVPADPAADAAMLGRLVAWCGRYTPWAAAEGRDGIFLDVTGCAHLFGGEAAMGDDLIHRIGGFGFAVRIAVADTPGAAWGVARFEGHGAIVPSGGAREVLSRLPVGALRLDPKTVGGLARVGIRTVEELRNMPRAPLAARFGAEVGYRLDQASGAIREPISPRAPVVPFRARLAFAEPIALTADIERGVRHLLDDLCRRLTDAGRGGRRLVLTLYRVDGEIFETVVGAARPARDPDRLARLFNGRLSGFEPAFGVEVMTLAASVSEPLLPAAASLPTVIRSPAMSDKGFRGDRLAPLIDRLGNRLGFDRVVRLSAVASHLPERAMRPAPALDESVDFTWVPSPPRPLSLLERPERIVASLPDQASDRPPERFRWRRADHEVRLAEGPERIAAEWWIDDSEGKTRDYWRVEDAAGRRFWICRHGMPRSGTAPEWFLHGLFA